MLHVSNPKKFTLILFKRDFCKKYVFQMLRAIICVIINLRQSCFLDSAKRDRVLIRFGASRRSAFYLEIIFSFRSLYSARGINRGREIRDFFLKIRIPLPKFLGEMRKKRRNTRARGSLLVAQVRSQLNPLSLSTLAPLTLVGSLIKLDRRVADKFG